MRSLVEQLSSYAAYHRDRRNIATHFVGIPMIVVAIEALLARPSFSLAGLTLSPAAAVTAAALGFYVALDRRYGVVMAVVLGGAFWAGTSIASLPFATWLGLSLGLFVVGWVFQLVGHVFEGRKPAFVDDLVGLLVGPLFVVAEAGFAFGLGEGLRAKIEERVGPTRGRADAQRQTP